MYQPDYTHDSRHNPKSGFEKVLKAAGVPFLEVEINELQDIQNTLRSKLFRELLTSGFMFKLPVTVDQDKINAGRMFALIDGNPVEVSDTSITLPSPPSSGARDDLVLLEAWRQVVTQDDTITENGGEDTNVIENGIADERLDVETSRRVQWRWRIRVVENATSVDSPSVGAYQKQYEGEEIYVANDPSTYDGAIYALPLFVVNRSGSLTLDQITDLRPKAELKQLDLSPVEQAIQDLGNLIDQYKQTLEEAIGSVQDTLSQSLTDHISDTDVHGATPEATANRIAMRDDSGQIKVSAPSDNSHVVRKVDLETTADNVYDAFDSLDEYVTNQLIDLGTNINDVLQALNTHKESDDHDGRYYTEDEIDTMLAGISSTNIKPEISYKYSADQRPSEYPEGVSVHFTMPDKGFPSYGTVLTVRKGGNDDRGAMQLLIPYGDGVLRYRLGIQDAPYWTEWKRLDTYTDLTVTGTLRIPVS